MNVDETTYMFSPKVLDRANVIESRTEAKDVEEFVKKAGGTLSEIEQAPAGYAEGFLDLSRRARTAPLPDLELLRNETPPEDATAKLAEIRKVVGELFDLLQRSHREFGYRTINEILRYVAVDYELTNPRTEWKWETCMDAQIIQKILPKLHGSKRQIEDLLIRLAVYCEARKVSSDDKAPAHMQTSPVKPANNPIFPTSYRKLCEMIDAVRRDQFVSFIQ